jgi:hypothetical protein
MFWDVVTHTAPTDCASCTSAPSVSVLVSTPFSSILCKHVRKKIIGYNAVQPSRCLLKFQRNLLPSLWPHKGEMGMEEVVEIQEERAPGGN